MVAHGDPLGAVFPDANVHRHPVWVHFPHHVAISVAYVILGILGHGTMRLVAGPAVADRPARRPWEPV
jgi:hypothetical protein